MNGPVQENPRGRSWNRSHRARLVIARACLPFALAVLSGCGQDAPPARVEGTLRIHGKPLENCLVTFLPESGQKTTPAHSIGVTDERGFYRLRLPDQREGASIGRHRVLVQDLSVSTGVRRQDHGTVDQEIGQATPPPPARSSRVPARYNSTEGTPLKLDVRPGPQVIDLDVR